jgi:hypothetical protein
METEREEEREKETTTEVWEAVGEEAVKGRCGVVARRGDAGAGVLVAAGIRTDPRVKRLSCRYGFPRS